MSRHKLFLEMKKRNAKFRTLQTLKSNLTGEWSSFPEDGIDAKLMIECKVCDSCVYASGLKQYLYFYKLFLFKKHLPDDLSAYLHIVMDEMEDEAMSHVHFKDVDDLLKSKEWVAIYELELLGE